MTTIKKNEIEKAIKELVHYVFKHDINPEEFKSDGSISSFKEFIYDKKVKEIINNLTKGKYKEYQIEAIVFEKKDEKVFLEKELLLEYQQYKDIPKTNLTYRYDTGNTNTKTKDHIHVFANKNELYAINKDGTKHDGSKARLGSKEIKFLKSIGFSPPPNGILEWMTLDQSKTYSAINIGLLFS